MSESASTTFTQSTTIQPYTSSVSKAVHSLTATNGVFVVSTSSITVTFESIAFQLSTSSALNYPLFYISKGSFTLTSITVTSENSNQASVSASIVKVNSGLSYYSTSTSISGCRFSLISYSSGNGTCLNAAMAGTDSLTISDTSMTSCSALYGGAMYLSLSGTPSPLSVSLTSYASNTATSYGPTLFVYTTSISYISETQFPNFIVCTESAANQAYGVESSGSPSRLIDLIGYTQYHCLTYDWEDEDDSMCSAIETMSEYDGVIYVDTRAPSLATCGAPQSPCMTLVEAFASTLFKTTSAGTIILLQKETQIDDSAIHSLQ